MSEPVYVKEEDLTLVGFDGANKEIYNYQGKPFTGFIREYYGDQLPICDIEYKNGYRDGAYIEYFDDPPGKRKSQYSEKYGVLNGEYKRWDKKGNLLYHALYKDHEVVEVYFGSRDSYNY